MLSEVIKNFINSENKSNNDINDISSTNNILNVQNNINSIASNIYKDNNEHIKDDQKQLDKIIKDNNISHDNINELPSIEQVKLSMSVPLKARKLDDRLFRNIGTPKIQERTLMSKE